MELQYTIFCLILPSESLLQKRKNCVEADFSGELCNLRQRPRIVVKHTNRMLPKTNKKLKLCHRRKRRQISIFRVFLYPVYFLNIFPGLECWAKQKDNMRLILSLNQFIYNLIVKRTAAIHLRQLVCLIQKR